MRVTVNIPIQLISSCSTLGDFTPLRFRFEDEDHRIIMVQIDEVINRKENNYSGIHEIIYTCQASIKEEFKLFDLRYSVLSHKWTIFQMLT